MSNIKIGFDLGNKSLKIAVLRKGVLEQHEVVMPENLMDNDTITMPHAFSAFLKKTKKELRLPSGPAGLILPASMVICRKITMPCMTVEQLNLNLPHEFSDFIHGEAHQYHCDYALCQPPEPIAAEGDEAAETTDKMTMMAAAVEKSQIQSYVKIFAAGGFHLRCILPEEMALIQLVDTCRRHRPDMPQEFCFIDLGYLTTRVFVCRSDQTQAVRRINFGCSALEQAAADILNVDTYLASTHLRTNHNYIQQHPRCLEVYERIAVEVLKIINFYHFTYRQNQLNEVYLIGGGAHIEPLRRILQESLGIPAVTTDILAGCVWRETMLDPSCMGAAGLILGRREGETV